MTDNDQFLEKEKQIINTVKQLETQVNDYTKWAWRSVIGGLVVLIIALVLFFVPDYEEFAKFLGSIVAAIWTLSGLFFVYVAFLGQKQSIQNQQLELFYNREELKATREELKGQKEQMIEQNKTLKQQQFENTFFNLFNNYCEYLEQNRNSIIRIWEGYHDQEQKNNYQEFFNSKIEDIDNTISKDYINKLFTILEFIHEKSFLEKNIYFSLLKEHTSKDVLFLNYLYSIYDDNKEKSHLIKKLYDFNNYKLQRFYFTTDWA